MPWSMLERRILAAALLFSSGCLFVAVEWAWTLSIPSPIWLALVGLAAMATVAPLQATQAGIAPTVNGSSQQTESLAQAAPPPTAETVAASPLPDTTWSGEERRRSHLIFSAASHELRTPINAIVGFAELLRDAERNNTGRKTREDYAATILDNATHLQHRLNDVLDANRLETGGMQLIEQDCDPAEIVEVVTRQKQDAAAERDITLIARLADGLNLHCDTNRLRQAIACVLDNAIKFSPADGIININMLRDRGGHLVISTTNTGPALKVEDAVHIFDPFRQSDEGSARGHGGLGLGLFIARGILRLHGGDVTLTSTTEAGTEVRIILPSARVKWLTSTNRGVAEARVA